MGAWQALDDYLQSAPSLMQHLQQCPFGERPPSILQPPLPPPQAPDDNTAFTRNVEFFIEHVLRQAQIAVVLGGASENEDGVTRMHMLRALGPLRLGDVQQQQQSESSKKKRKANQVSVDEFCRRRDSTNS